MTERIVLAYSGGLDTSVAIGWIGEATGAEVIAVAVDVGQGGESLETIRQRALGCGAVEAYVADASRRVRQRVLRAHAEGQRPLPGPLPAGLRHLPPGDRQAPGQGRPRIRRHHRGPRLHRQGQRPGPLRSRHPDPRPGPEVHRPGPRPRPDPRQGHRLRRGKGTADRDHQEEPVLDRPERLGPRRRNRLPRGHLERPHQGHLRLHRHPGIPAGTG